MVYSTCLSHGQIFSFLHPTFQTCMFFSDLLKTSAIFLSKDRIGQTSSLFKTFLFSPAACWDLFDPPIPNPLIWCGCLCFTLTKSKSLSWFYVFWFSVFCIKTSCSALGIEVLMLQFQVPIPLYISHGIWPFWVGRSLTALQWVLEGASQAWLGLRNCLSPILFDLLVSISFRLYYIVLSCIPIS